MTILANNMTAAEVAASFNNTIINLTQHAETAEQAAQGVFSPEDPANVAVIRTLLTFDTLPTKAEIEARAQTLAQIASEEGADAAMIGGAPYLMGALENALKARGIKPLYAFSIRESVEKTLPDGSIQKVNIFKHQGFVEV